jgi:hypothetical protein
MKWLVALETENDPIIPCRLMNVLRRKGLKIVTLAMAAGSGDFSVMSVLEAPEPEMEHLFHFLRRTEGVRDVTYYRHLPGAHASFVFIDADVDSSSMARFFQAFPGAKLIFGSHGKYLLEVPADSAADAGFDPRLLPLAQERTTRVLQNQWRVASG